jgi:hypothetical protein
MPIGGIKYETSMGVGAASKLRKGHGEVRNVGRCVYPT